MRWYDVAREVAESLAVGTPYSVEQCAAVLAITSPSVLWRRNCEVSRIIIAAHLAGIPHSDLGLCRNHRTVVSAYRALDGDLSAVSGPKVTAFFAAIMGDPHAVTLDRHCFKAAIGVERCGPVLRRSVDAAYRAAAAAVGVTPREMQATVWVAWRGSAE